MMTPLVSLIKIIGYTVDGEVDSDPDNEFEEIGLEQRGVAMPAF